MSAVVHPRTSPRARRTVPGTQAATTRTPFWRTHRVRACLTLALVTGSFIASGPVVARAAHRPVHGLPLERSTVQPGASAVGPAGHPAPGRDR